jgi:small subunit ribosomal protein S20
MPNTKSAKKAMRQNARRRIVNVTALEAVRKTAKNFKKLVASGSKSDAAKALSAAFAALDKAAKKNIIHKNNANRHKSRMSAMLAKIAK